MNNIFRYYEYKVRICLALFIKLIYFLFIIIIIIAYIIIVFITYKVGQTLKDIRTFLIGASFYN
jgi:hypothetical protein